MEKGLRILVVDDNEDMRSVLNQSLSSIGHIVKTVENGTDALELAKREGFDIVLCDLIMPDIYGYDVIKALNGLEKSPKIGIITGWGEELNPQENEGLKVDFIVKKPFKLSYLTKQISEAFAR
jgi:CheY-like chemotaxis protein